MNKENTIKEGLLGLSFLVAAAGIDLIRENVWAGVILAVSSIALAYIRGMYKDYLGKK